MKLDQKTKFKCQQYTHERRDVPFIDEVLQLVDWLAQASELSVPHKAEWKHSIMEKKPEPRTLYLVAKEQKCTTCNEASHPLYACRTFQALQHEQRLHVATVRRHGLSMNCLHYGHCANQCQSFQKCNKSCGTRRTLLHKDTGKAIYIHVKPHPCKPIWTCPKKPPVNVTSNFSNSNQGSELLMTWQVIVQCPNGSTGQERALLDSGSEASSSLKD